jgi:hypothetical protein
MADIWGNLDVMSRFWIKTAVFVLLIIFGYASPALAQRIGAKVARERLQDILLGFFIGLLNGLLIVGTMWFYLDEAYYGVPPAQVTDPAEEGQLPGYPEDAQGIGGIRPPEEDSPAANLRPYLPPTLISKTYLYVAVALSFIFVLIVFV